MIKEKRAYVVSALLVLIAVLLMRILAVQLTNFWLTPKIGNTYSRYQKLLVNNNEGGFYEEAEYNQVKVYNYTNDSVFYIMTMYNGVNCNDSSSATIVEFAKLYR